MHLQSRGRWEKWVSDWGISTPDASFLARESRPDLPRRGSTCGSRDWGLLPDKEPESKGPQRGQLGAAPISPNDPVLSVDQLADQVADVLDFFE
ncbi:hypothetical protein GW17_00017745 [Ensete ventricosum]|nr:hypothetical protein GW17_00017745 [Ensete ventricosum]